MSTIPWTTRLTPDDKAHAERAIKYIIDTEGLTGKKARADAIRFIMDQALLGFSRDETPTAHQYVLDAVLCPYLRTDKINWLCDETVGKSIKRESAVLGSVTEPEIVIAKCQAHLRKLQEIRDEKIRDILAKQSIVKFGDFYRKMMKFSRDGLDVDFRMCIVELPDGKFTTSVDGKTLKCPKLGEYIDIETVCRQTIDLSKGVPPCEFFAEVVHSVILDEMESFKRKVEVEVTPRPCSAYSTSDCPGTSACTVDLFKLARANGYCPEQYIPKKAVPLLSSDSEPEDEETPP